MENTTYPENCLPLTTNSSTILDDKEKEEVKINVRAITLPEITKVFLNYIDENYIDDSLFHANIDCSQYIDESSKNKGIPYKAEIGQEYKNYNSDNISSEELREIVIGNSEDNFNWLIRFFTGYGSYWMLHFVYFILLSLLGSIISYIFEKGDVAYIDSLFIAVSASTMTGLTSCDFSKYSMPSKIVTIILFVFGNIIVMSALPVIIRRHFYRRRARLAFKALNQSSNYYVAIDNKKSIHNLLQKEVTEYQALSIILVCVFVYFFVLQLFSFFLLLLYFVISSSFRSILADYSINIWFFSLFHTVSSFNNCGFMLTYDNMIPFIQNRFLLLLTSLNILLGNTFYPPCMRLFILTVHKLIFNKRFQSLLSFLTPLKNKLLSYISCYSNRVSPTSYLLKHTRQCFTHMFDKQQTNILICVLLGILLVEFVTCISLEYNKSDMNNLSFDLKFLVGFFQSVSIRTAGFNVINPYNSAKALQLIWVIFMYVSPYPFIMALSKSSTKVTNRNKCILSLCNSLNIQNNTNDSFNAVNTKAYKSYGKNGVHQPINNSDNLDFINEKYIKKNCNDDNFIATYSNNKTTQVDNNFEINVEKAFDSDNSGSLNYDESRITKHWKYVVQEAQKLLLKDLFWLLAVTIFICIFEEKNFQKNPTYLNIFSIFFEIISAYGCVGLSLGYYGINSSLSTAFTPVSKLLIIIVMLLGRQRGLPSSIDKAVNVVDLLNVSVLSLKKKKKLKIFSKIRRCMSQPCNIQTN